MSAPTTEPPPGGGYPGALAVERVRPLARLMSRDPQTAQPADGDLLRQVASGSPEALEVLYQRYERRLWRYIGGFLRDRTMAEEVACETFVEVWRGAERFRGDSTVATWIFGIARHKALSVLRARGRVGEGEESLASMLSGDLDALDRLSDEQVATRVRGALEALSPEHREVIELSIYHDFSYPQVAEIIGCPLNTVKTRAYYARQHLKRVLSEATQEGSHDG